MTDLALITGKTEDDITYVDIDIVDGQPTYLAEATQTNDQRASLAIYAAKGAMPGELDFGVSWDSIYSQEDTTIQLSNELQQQITEYTGTSSADTFLPQTQYNAQLLVSDDGIGVIVSRGQ